MMTLIVCIFFDFSCSELLDLEVYCNYRFMTIVPHIDITPDAKLIPQTFSLLRQVLSLFSNYRYFINCLSVDDHCDIGLLYISHIYNIITKHPHPRPQRNEKQPFQSPSCCLQRQTILASWRYFQFVKPSFFCSIHVLFIQINTYWTNVNKDAS